MGQTLTHGIYLPDEGERNCYDGLAGNWQLLDGAVGTVAEHTTALAGKAPAVHTHTKSDITDFPAYGTTAGTICEGNDSRLSDARTPVAHTHSKSDVTDLFNSANAWTGENIFNNDLLIKNANATQGTAPSSNKTWTLTFCDSNKATTGQLYCQYRTNGSIYLPLRINNGTYDYRLNFILDAAGNAVFSPSVSGIIDLGSSSYQWNNLYAKNYYYNGTQWGLDQGNTWTGANIFYKSIQIHGSRNAYIMPEFGASYSGLVFGTVEFKQSFKFGDWVDNNSTIGLNTSNAYVEIYAGLDSSDSVNKARLNPVNTTVAELGTSTNKWKTLNGINPGALSLPDINTSIAVDTTNWVYDGATFNEIKINNATQTISGWLYIIINNVSSDDVIVVRYAGSDSGNLTYAQYKSGLSYVSLVAPIMPGVKTYVASRKAFSTIKIYPCLGNV